MGTRNECQARPAGHVQGADGRNGEGSSTEPQTLNYEWYISDDGGTIHLYEKYADSDAMIAHLGGFLEKWAPRFMSCVDPTRFTVYGDPSDKAREMLAAFSPTYLDPWGGFAR